MISGRLERFRDLGPDSLARSRAKATGSPLAERRRPWAPSSSPSGRDSLVFELPMVNGRNQVADEGFGRESVDEVRRGRRRGRSRAVRPWLARLAGTGVVDVVVVGGAVSFSGTRRDKDKALSWAVNVLGSKLQGKTRHDTTRTARQAGSTSEQRCRLTQAVR